MRDPGLQWDGRFFDPQYATERWEELDGIWQPFGPFEKALDYFGDGSFWILDAPGHMAGNLAAAARIETGEWVLLGSDCCHSRQVHFHLPLDIDATLTTFRDLLDGRYEIADFPGPNNETMSLHADLKAAKQTMEKIRILENDYRFHTALAHDASWLKQGTDRVLMSLLDDEMKAAARERIPHDEIP